MQAYVAIVSTIADQQTRQESTLSHLIPVGLGDHLPGIRVHVSDSDHALQQNMSH